MTADTLDTLAMDAQRVPLIIQAIQAASREAVTPTQALALRRAETAAQLAWRRLDEALHTIDLRGKS